MTYSQAEINAFFAGMIYSQQIVDSVKRNQSQKLFTEFTTLVMHAEGKNYDTEVIHKLSERTKTAADRVIEKKAQVSSAFSTGHSYQEGTSGRYAARVMACSLIIIFSMGRILL